MSGQDDTGARHDAPSGQDRTRVRPSRRAVLVGLGVVVAGGAAATTVALLADDSGGSDDADGNGSGRGEGAHQPDRTASGTAVPSATPSGPPRPGTLVWRVATRGADLLGLAGGTAVLVEGERTMVGVDLASGKRRWTRPLLLPGSQGGAASYSTALNRDGGLYAGRADLRVSRITPATGEAAWTYTVTPPGTSDGSRSADGPPPHLALSADGKTLYVASAGLVAALDTETGGKHWVHVLENSSWLPVFRKVTVLSDTTLLLEAEEEDDPPGPQHEYPQYYFDIPSRTLIWHRTADEAVGHTPERVLADYYGNKDGLSLVDTVDGSPLWNGRAATLVGVLPAQRVFVVRYAKAGGARPQPDGCAGLSLEDGHTVWTADRSVVPVSFGSSGSGTFVVARVMDGQRVRSTRALDPRTGKVRWEAENTSAAAGDGDTGTFTSVVPVATVDPAASGGPDPARTQDYKALDPATGTPVWTFSAPGGHVRAVVEDPARDLLLLHTAAVPDGKAAPQTLSAFRPPRRPSRG